MKLSTFVVLPFLLCSAACQAQTPKVRPAAVAGSFYPADPKELYAGIWRAERKPWTLISGGPALRCGLYKSTNSGTTWTKLDNGLPRNLIGKIDVDVSRANPKRVYVILEAPGAEAGGRTRGSSRRLRWTGRAPAAAARSRTARS